MPSAPNLNLVCPCGSSHQYSSCCKPFHDGANAPSPESLMRSRFAAYVFRLEAYLLFTWHESTRPPTLDMRQQPDWTSLVVLSADASEAEGTVAFRAIYRESNGWRHLDETSRFVRENDRWFYVDGATVTGNLKPQRNDLCPCGSGEKFKRCCI